MTNRPNALNLNALQLKTLAILQQLARFPDYADQPEADGSVLIRRMPHAHGDHMHVGDAVVAGRDATGLANPAVFTALARKGLLTPSSDGLPILTSDGQAYDTGIADEILHRASH